MFYVIGLGLGDAKDVTVKGLEIIKRCDRVYLEAYTSVLSVGKEKLVSILIEVNYYCCFKLSQHYYNLCL